MSRYSEYVGADQILDLGFVVSADAAGASAKADELHFKRIHMESELSLAQVLTDMHCAVDFLKPQTDVQKARFHLDRTAGIIKGMEAKLNLLRPPYFTQERFEEFRDLLAPASGSQSASFARVRHFLGLEGTESPIYKQFINAVAGHGTSIPVVLRSPASPLYEVAHALLGVATAYESWAWSHYQNMRLVVGEKKEGTAGTLGADFLKGRMVAPFPELWSAIGVKKGV